MGSSFALVCNAVRSLWMLSEVCRFPNLHSFSASCIDLELGPLPSTGITQLLRYYEPLRHPVAPGLSLTGVRLIARPITPQGFPCCVCLPLPYMPSPIPRRNHRLLFVRFTCDDGLPRILGGSASVSSFSRPAQCSLILRPARSPSPYKDPLHRRLQPIRYLHDCSSCYRSERKLPGGILHR